MNNYPEVVKRIHNEFNNAGERLLQESLALIEKAEKVDSIKANRLSEAGFANHPLVKKSLEIAETINTPTEMARMVMDYKNKFPLYKFITTNDADIICNKYQLIRGNSEQYKGFVPEKNLAEILNFKNTYKLLKRLRVTKIKVSALFDGRLNAMMNPKCRAVMSFIKDNNYTFMCNDEYEIEWKIKQVADSVKGDSWFRLQTLKTVDTSVFDICAPKKDMISNNLFEKMFPKFEMEVTVPDPVVLYPVKHGFIIVTAWGDEASDPLVVNENNN